MFEHGEFEDFFVELHPVVHLAEFNVSDKVIDVLEAGWVFAVVLVDGQDAGEAGLRAAADCWSTRTRIDLAEAGHECAALFHVGEFVRAGAGDKGVDAAAVGANGGDGDAAGGIAIGPGFAANCGRCAVFDRAFKSFFCIEDGERDVFDAVAVHGDFEGSGVFGRQAAGEQEADVALGEEIACGIAIAGGEIVDLFDLEAEAVSVEERGLLGVTNMKADVVDIDQLEWIGAGLKTG